MGDENDLAFILQEQLNSNLAGSILLVISNLFLVPAIFESFEIGEEASAIVYFSLLVASSLYHACRSGLVCLVAYIDHRKLDYLFVYTAVIWTLTTGLGRSHAIPLRRRLVVYYLFFLPVAIMIVGNYEGHWVQLVGGLLPGLTMVVIARMYGVALFRRPALAFVALFFGGIAGLFMFIMPYYTYEWSHSVWHIFSMLALAFLIYSTRRHHRYVNVVDDPEKFRTAMKR